MSLTVVLPNGETKNQSEVKVEEVRSALPIFMQIAVGEENGWYVQTTDTHEETYLSYPIAVGLESKEKAMEIANNLSEITGMKILEWTK